jgi:hypothetical protein
MAKGLTEDELRALTDSEMRQAVGYYGGKLAEMRRKAEYYYLGLAEGDLAPTDIEGRSSVVSTDVRNTIESMLPQLMVKFVGGDSVVEFEAAKPGDEEKAQQCTDYLNYLFFKKNNGHNITYTWLKDALLQKRGIIKVWWDTRTEEKREEYRGLDEVELAQIMEDPEVEPIEQVGYPDEDDAKHRQEALQQLMPAVQAGDQNAAMQLQQMQATPPKMLYDVTFKRSSKAGKLCVENVPPEEFLISRKAKTIEDAPFVGHRVARTLSELRSMGYKNVDNIASDDQAASLNAERIERLAFDDEQAYLQMEPTNGDESQRVVWVTECYVRCDFDGDGIAELRKVVRAGNEILENEVVDIVPFVSICPIPLPHKFFGLSIADLGMESQRIKTSIMRAQLDNLYLQVNGRYFAVENQVNLDDLLTSRPGGVVRVKGPGAVGRLDQGAGDAGDSMNMIQYMEDFLENSTGWTRYSQGNDASALNKTATGMNIITNRADMRLDLIARNFAEGFVELFRQMLKLVCQYQDTAQEVKIAGNWVPIDPREWRNQFDVSINVGLGTGNKDQNVQHLMLLGQVITQAAPILPPQPEKVHNLITELAKNMGFKSADKFLPDPKQIPPQQDKPDPKMAEVQGKLQLEQQKAQAEMMLEREKTQLEQQQQQHLNEVEAQRQELQAQRQMQLEQMKFQHDMQVQQMRIVAEQEFQRFKAQLDAETKIMVAQITAKTTATPEQDAAADHAVES